MDVVIKFCLEHSKTGAELAPKEQEVFLQLEYWRCGTGIIDLHGHTNQIKNPHRKPCSVQTKTQKKKSKTLVKKTNCRLAVTQDYYYCTIVLLEYLTAVHT